MNSGLFTESVTCPICEKKFSSINVETSLFKPDHTDEDFCVHYTEINPLVYEPLICSRCGYASLRESFKNPTQKEKEVFQKFCVTKFTDDPAKKPFELNDYFKQVYGYTDSTSSVDERDNNAGISACKIVLLSMEARNAPYISRAKVTLRIGWIYRLGSDPLEFEYLQTATDYFAMAFEAESFDEGEFDSETCAFMVGELSRRLGKPKEAMEWFVKAAAAAKVSENSLMTNKISDQMKVLKSSPEYDRVKNDF